MRSVDEYETTGQNFRNMVPLVAEYPSVGAKVLEQIVNVNLNK